MRSQRVFAAAVPLNVIASATVPRMNFIRMEGSPWSMSGASCPWSRRRIKSDLRRGFS
jgi:hypothetical protein